MIRTIDHPVLCTTTEQSNRLLKVGINSETADMTWCNSAHTPQSAYGEEHRCLFAHPGITTSHDPTGTPCWSINALMNLLPHTMPDKLDPEKEVRLTIQPTLTAWQAFYCNDDHIGESAVAQDLNECLVSLIEKTKKI